jgi:hypothetical protein
MRSPICRLLAPVLLIAAAFAPLRAADTPPRALPLDAPLGAPAFVDVVTFAFHSDAEDHKVIVTTSPTLARFDLPDDRYSFIYDPKTQFYTGLEHNNDTYWTFSWPEVRAAVENSRRGEKRLQELALDGLNPDSTQPTNTPSASPPDNSALTNGDDSGYVWKQGGRKKRIAGIDCELWVGETVSGENCTAWCHPGPVPKVTEAVARLREVDEPMALVPVRIVVPDFIFPVYDALTKGGLTPVQINWGSDTDASEFGVVDQQERHYEARLFAVPNLYIKTTLITMDGLIPEQPAPGPRGNPTPPRIDHLAPAPNPIQPPAGP